MNKTEALRQLESLGTAQNRKIYARHGIEGDVYGVSYANLGKLKKKIKVDHDLALALFDSGVHDARVLATMIVDPERLTARQLDGWVKVAKDYATSDAVAGVVARSPIATGRVEKWIGSRSEFVAAAGWNTLTHLCWNQDRGFDDAQLRSFIDRIEAEIHGAKNRTRYSMNGALISIGSLGGKLQKAAMAAAKRIGKVEVDHGETGCKTPDAYSYIQKTVAHRTELAKRRAAKKKAGKKAAKKTKKKAGSR